MYEDELIAAKRKLSVQNLIIKEFASSTNIENTLHNIITILCKYYGWKIGILWLADKNNNLKYVTSHCPFYLQSSKFMEMTRKMDLKPGEGVPGIILKEKRTKWLESFNKYGVKERAKAAADIHINSIYVAPILIQNKALGVI
jgi:transcriptional regulator with GAF, ATPase, and Fis domain